MSWDLNDLYRGADDPRLWEDLEGVKERARAFTHRYKGELARPDLDAKTLFFALKGYESIHDVAMKAYAYAWLRWASNTRDGAAERLLKRVREAWAHISEGLTFFEVEIMALPEKDLKALTANEALSEYRHYLMNLARRRVYTLSEAEEGIIKTKDLSGKEAFISLYQEIMGALVFTVPGQGAVKRLNKDQVLGLLYSPEAGIRERAMATLFNELGEKGRVFKTILNALILDHQLECRRRGYPSPMDKGLLANGVDAGTVENMMVVVEKRYPSARRYYRTKASLLGLKGLKLSDIYAPLGGEKIIIEYPRAKSLVLDVLKAFHPLFYSLACEFFEKGRIDREGRTGKLSGAFCKCYTPSQPPYLSLAYTGEMRDLITLAHELGHGIHYRLSSRQGFLNFAPSPLMAETASTFLERVLMDHLLERGLFDVSRTALAACHLEGIFLGIFRQNVLTRFEQRLYQEGGDGLGEEEICQIWWEENAKLYGPDVEMEDSYRWGWTAVPHFFGLPFYCYSYISGNLLSLVLFERYKRKGGPFLEEVIDLFSSGAASWDRLKDMGFDLRDRDLWDEAFEGVEALVDGLNQVERPGPV